MGDHSGETIKDIKARIKEIYPALHGRDITSMVKKIQSGKKLGEIAEKMGASGPSYSSLIAYVAAFSFIKVH